MLLSFSLNTIELRQWERRDEMQSYLDSNSEAFVLIGENPDQERYFHSLLVHYSGSREPAWGVGVISMGLGVQPALLPLPPDQLLLGNDFEAVALNTSERREVFRFRFDTPFRSFIHLQDSAVILIFNEIGVVAATFAGQESWRYEQDVITDYAIENGLLRMSFMDSPSVVLALETGRRVE